MKLKNLFFTLLLCAFTNFVTAQEVITNESIIQMMDLGFDDTMIIDKIYTSDVKFDATIAGLGALKKAGVSSEVISLVMEKSKQNTKSKTGIYFLNEDNEPELIQPAVFSGKNSNQVAQKLVSGFINAKKRHGYLEQRAIMLLKPAPLNLRLSLIQQLRKSTTYKTRKATRQDY
jgi:hypothetical protein